MNHIALRDLIGVCGPFFKDTRLGLYTSTEVKASEMYMKKERREGLFRRGADCHVVQRCKETGTKVKRMIQTIWECLTYFEIKDQGKKITEDLKLTWKVR